MVDLLIPTRRRFLIGSAALFVAPAVIKAASLMPVHSIRRGPRTYYCAISKNLNRWDGAEFVAPADVGALQLRAGDTLFFDNDVTIKTPTWIMRSPGSMMTAKAGVRIARYDIDIAPRVVRS